MGRCRASREVSQHSQLGVVQGGILGLLGLLLGFCFSGAMSRFIDRQDILVREANAISSVALLTSLLDDPHKATVDGLLRDYTLARIELFHAQSAASEAPIQARLASIQKQLWSAAVEGVRDRPLVTGVLLPPISDAFDLLSVRNAANRRHMPMLIFLVLLGCAAASIAAIGFGVEAGDKRLRFPAAILSCLIAATLWTTLDLDFPRLGLVRVDDGPLLEVLAMLPAHRATTLPASVPGQ